MYTEENEFDYNDYLNETDDYNTERPSNNKGLIIKIAIILLCLLLVIFLMFKIKNRNNDNSDTNSDDIVLVYNNNVSTLRKASETYFFTNQNLPQEVGNSITININDLKNANLVTEILDYDGTMCGYNTSYLTLTRNANDYKLEINLLCPSIENSTIYYYDLEYNCLTCNGEEYVPSLDEENNENPEEDNTQEEDTTVVCGGFSDWTTEYLANSNLERESRVVIIGYKENISYGEWSEPIKEVITATDTLEVKTETKEETISETSEWSSESTSKPASKEGREISSRSVKKTYTSSCTTTTYEKELNYWDNDAIKCTSPSFGKFICTYSKETCPTKTKTITYYKYRDTTTSIVTNTYYSSRTIIKGDTLYTDYILESEMPEGYKKLEGSEVTQYRYREACTK